MQTRMAYALILNVFLVVITEGRLSTPAIEHRSSEKLESGTGTAFVFHCQYHSTDAAYSLVYFLGGGQWDC